MKAGNKKSFTEETLDPANWKELRALGHRMLDNVFDYTENIRNQRTLPLTPQAIEEICTPLSEDGEGEEKVYEIYQHSILPYTLNIPSPKL